MRRYFLLLGSVLFLSNVTIAQTTPADTSYWKSGSQSTITFSQVSLTNWAAGGENSTAVNGFFNVFADYRKGRRKWHTSLDLGYGLLKQGEKRIRKSDDQINFVTRFGYQLNPTNEKLYLSTFLNLRTQFAEGYAVDDPDSLISKFLAPGYLTVGVGLEYAANEFVSFGYKPLAGKFTFVSADIVGDAGAYGVESGKTSRVELGSYFRFSYKQEAFKNVNVDTRFELFTGYETEAFGNIDVNWQNTIVMKINEHLSTNLFTQLLYDDDVKIDVDTNNDGVVDQSGPRVQFKSVFGIGLIYQFGDKIEK